MTPTTQQEALTLVRAGALILAEIEQIEMLAEELASLADNLQRTMEP